MRFASQRDIARAVERGVRRAGLPIAYSAGFTPHPKISYAGAAPTGTASEAEYLELSLTRACDPADVRDRLDTALPDGIDVIDVTEEAGSLAALPLEVSEWQVVLPGVRPDEAARAAGAFLAAGSIPVERLTSKGKRQVDARTAVLSLETRCAADQRDAGNAMLRMVVWHVTPAVRPDDVLAGLRHVAQLALPSPALVTRLAQRALSAAEAAGAAAARASVPAAPQQPAQVAAQPPGPGAAHEQVETTRLPEGSATPAGAAR